MSSDFIDFMRSRVSCASLTAPAPTRDEWWQILDAASRAADHGGLKPWRFKIYQGDGLNQLGQCYWQNAKQEVAELTEAKQASFVAKAYRAPCVLLVYAKIESHPKVPAIEQVMAVAAACQQVLLGLSAKGYGAMWRTGPVAHSELTKTLLGLESQDQVVGFVYVGTPTDSRSKVAHTDIESRVEWVEA